MTRGQPPLRQHDYRMPRGSALGTMKHLRCRCLGGMTLYPQTQLSTIPQTQQLQMHAYKISVQQSQFSALVMQSEANQC